jgi:transposase
MIRIDIILLATEALDMRAGTETILARVVKVFGAARPHPAYLFANKSSTRIKVLVYDGFGIWALARRLNKRRFVWTDGRTAIAVPINPEQSRRCAFDRAAVASPLARAHDQRDRSHPGAAPSKSHMPRYSTKHDDEILASHDLHSGLPLLARGYDRFDQRPP